MAGIIFQNYSRTGKTRLYIPDRAHIISLFDFKYIYNKLHVKLYIFNTIFLYIQLGVQNSELALVSQPFFMLIEQNDHCLKHTK